MQVNCFIADFYDWLNPQKVSRNITADRVEGQEFLGLLQEFLSIYPYDKWYIPSIGVADGRIRFVRIYFNTTEPFQQVTCFSHGIITVWSYYLCYHLIQFSIVIDIVPCNVCNCWA